MDQVNIYIRGGKPLVGNISIKGSVVSSYKLLFASLYSNEDVVLKNVQRVPSFLKDLSLIESLGARIQWMGTDVVSINASSINTYEVDNILANNNKTALLLAGPLLFRFGKVVLPKFKSPFNDVRPINRWLDTWRSLGINVEEDEDHVYLSGNVIKSSFISFKTTTHMGTDNAIISSLFTNGEVVISNAAEEPEVDDLIKFCNALGANVVREQNRQIRITGVSLFKGCTFTVQPDRHDIVSLTVGALITDGNLVLSNIDRSIITPFVNILTKMGCRYEFTGSELRVWHGKDDLLSQDVVISPEPGVSPTWQPLITLLLTKATGASMVHDTVYTDNFEYTKELNRMGANIKLYKPQEVSVNPVVSNDAYDYKNKGEPISIAKVLGPTRLHAERLIVQDPRSIRALILAGTVALGETELVVPAKMAWEHKPFIDDLINLGAIITFE